MNKNLKKIVLCMALSTSVLVSGNTVKYFNVIDTVKADENVTTTPVMTDPNNASIADAPFNKPGYALDPNTSRYTFGVWQFLRTDPNTKTKTNFDYYATLSVDRDAITGNPGSNPKVYLRIVKKSTGAEVYTRELNAGDSDIQLPSYITNNAAGVTNTLTYVPANGPTPGTLTFSLVHANLEYETLQVRDTELPGNENEDKPNVQTTVPFKKPEQITYYREIDESKYTEGQPYKPTGDEEVITKYVQEGISGQKYVASDNRDIKKYERIEATTDNNQPKTGLVKHVAGQKLVELKGGANHYYVKRISEVVDSKGSTVTRLYALDPSEVDNFNGDDVGSTDVSKYTLLYTTKVNAPGEIWTAEESKVTRVDSKNGDYYIDVTETAGSRSLVITGWFSKTEKVTYIADEDKQPRQYNKPFTKGPDVALTAAGKGNNGENVIAGKTTAIVAKTKVTQPDGSFTYIGLEGFTSFSNNYSVPTPPNGSTDVNYYFRKLKGEVEITYVDDKGNKIKDPKQDTPKSPYDTPYDTTEEGEKPNTIEKDGKTYKLVPKGDYPVGKVDENGHLVSSDPITGKVDKPKSVVTYVYKEVKEDPVQPKGNVYVHYKDTEGNELKTSVKDMDQQPVDSDYDTVVDNRPNEIEKDGKTYVLVPAGNYTVGEVDNQGHLKSSDPTTGKVAEQDKNVTYIYKLKEDPKKGEVVITYVDENGNELKDPKQDTPKSPYDTPYDTTEEGEKPNTIEKDGKTYKLVPKGDYPVGKVDENGHLVSSDPITGKVDKPKSVVTYVYKEVKEDPVQPKGNVYVHYKDTEGNELKTSVKDMDQQPVDSDYDTVVDNRPNEIEKDGKTYVLVPAGNYTVGEVDNQGHLKSSDPTTGKVAEQDKNVTYIYKLKEDPKKGEVVITYVDENGNELKDPKQDTPKSPYDTPYDTTEEGEKPNTIEKDGKTYKLVPKGDYPVGKVDENGHLVSSDPITGKVDKPKSVVTYVYKEVKEDPVQPKGNVYVHYKDTEGNELKTSVKDMDQQPVDSDYDTVVDNRPNEIEKDGKTYVLVPAGNYTVGEVDNQGHLKSSDPTTGKVAEQDKNVTYIYKLKEDPTPQPQPDPAQPKGNVYVHYKDTEGNELKTSVKDMDQQPVDSDYDTVVDNRPNEIEKDGKTYVLVPAGNYTVGEVDNQGHLKSSDPTTGKVAEQDKNVTYIYKLKEDPTPQPQPDPAQPKGNVYVYYKDTEGNVIKSRVTDEDAQPVDKDYDTVVDNRPQEIVKDGKTYVLVPAGNYTVGSVDSEGHLESSDSTTGKVVEGDKHVTYIYKLKEEPVVPGKPGKPGEPGKPGDPGKGNRLPKTGVASSSALLSLVTVLTGAMGIVINSKKRK